MTNRMRLSAVRPEFLRRTGGAVFQVQIDLSSQQAALCIDVANDYPGDVCIGDPSEREWTRLVRDHSPLDGVIDWS